MRFVQEMTAQCKTRWGRGLWGLGGLVLGLAMAGCGDGAPAASFVPAPPAPPGPETPRPPDPEPTTLAGRWVGTLGVSVGTVQWRRVQVILAEDGELWLLYTAMGNAELAAGFWHGRVTLEAHGASGTVTDYSQELGMALPVGLALTGTATQILTGTVRYANGSTTALTLGWARGEEQTPDQVAEWWQRYPYRTFDFQGDFSFRSPTTLRGAAHLGACTFDGTITTPAHHGAWPLVLGWQALPGCETHPDMRGVLVPQVEPNRLWLAAKAEDGTFVLIGGIDDGTQ